MAFPFLRHTAAAAGLLAAALLAAAPAAAQQQQQGLGESFGGLQLDGSKPISIESNKLDVDDKAATATFTGNVHVAQGDTELRTGKLVVTYDKGGSGAGAGSGAGGAGAIPGGSDQIKHLDASDKVYVKSKDQVATAEQASFDMASQVIVMTGNVVLTQGKNVAEGCRLTIHADTGIAHLESSDCNGAPGGGGDGRVRLMLTPDKKQQ